MANRTARKRADMTDDEVPQNGKSEMQRPDLLALGEAMSFWFAIASPLISADQFQFFRSCGIPTEMPLARPKLGCRTAAGTPQAAWKNQGTDHEN